MQLGLFSVVDHYPHHVERNVARFYEELLEQARLADELGFESFWIAEHHFSEYGVVPRPAIILASMAAVTSNIKLGTAVTVLPFDDPLRIAEDYAMLDILSKGRMILGVGSGYLQHEFAGFNLDLATKREYFDESLQLIRLAWRGQPINFNGTHYKVKDVRLNVLPLQSPPQIAVAMLRNESAAHIGAMGLPIMTIPYATTELISELKLTVDAFRSAFVVSHGPENARAYFGLHTYCAESTEDARIDCRSWMDLYVKTRLYAKQRSFDALVEKDLIACGDPDEILRVARRYKAAGLTDFLAITNFGGMPNDKVVASMKLIAKHVIPELND